ncbi:MAG: thioredoxin domain-containing protein [Patescibacteria group bacterium]|nr:thioredoxin domain-containing protein [Patescibacteria group bacterium]
MKKLYLILFITAALAGVFFFTQYKKMRGITITHKTTDIISQQIYNIPISNSEEPYGNPGAPMTIVEFIDLNNRDSRDIHLALVAFINKNTQSARLFWKDAPYKGIIFQNDIIAHKAVFCAAKQKKGWEFANKIATEKKINEAILQKVGQSVDFNIGNWWLCANSQEAKDYIDASAALSKALGVNSAPAIFVNNRRLNLDTEIPLEEILNKFIVK